MSERDIKSEMLVEFIKSRNYSGVAPWYDGTVVKVIRIDNVDVQVLLSAQANERGAVKVGVYVNEPHFDTSRLHEWFGNVWMPDGTVRENSANWDSNDAGVQMWFRIEGINWNDHFDDKEMIKVVEVFHVVYAKAFNRI